MATESTSDPQLITPRATRPVRRNAMSQSWRHLTFLHWPYDPSSIRHLLPPGLELDVFDGAAWIGLVPFEIYNLRGLGHFPETNVRTYVIGPDGSRAVWFFSLDAARLVAVVGARGLYGLPYVWAKMRVTLENGSIRYRSRRKWPHASDATTDIVVNPGERYLPEEITQLTHFLTARYRLYSMKGGRLARAQVEHEPWPLARATVLELNQTLIEAAGLPSPAGDPLIHYSEQIDVRVEFLSASYANTSWCFSPCTTIVRPRRRTIKPFGKIVCSTG